MARMREMMEAMSGARFALDPQRLPWETTVAPHRAVPLVFVAVGALFVVVGLGLALGAGEPLALLHATLGAAVLWFGLAALGGKRLIRVEPGTVIVGTGRRRRSAPIADYRGVLLRELRYKSGNRHVVVQRIELVHDDPALTVPIYQREGSDEPRAAWESYARAFGLPALHEDAGALVARDPADLDTPLRRLAAEGRIAPAAPNGPPPPALVVQAGEDEIVVVLRRPPVPWWFLLPFFAVPAVILAVAADAPPAFLAFPLLFLAIAGFVAAINARTRRAIVITRERIESRTETPLTGRASVEGMLLDDVETVAVGGNGVIRALRIGGDHRRLKMAEGLSRAELAWLRDYVTMAIATA